MDNSHANYQLDTTDRLINLFKSTFGDYFKTYYAATPSMPPTAMDYPLVMVQKLRNKAVIGPTSTDELTERVAITIMINKADDLGSADVKTTTMRKLEHLVEGIDPATNQYHADSVLNALRQHLTLLQQSGSIWLIDSDCEISYTQAHRTDSPTIAIADITLTTQRRVIVPNRQ